MDERSLLENLDVGLAGIAPDWTVSLWTKGATRVTGLAADSVVGRNFWAVFPTAQGTAVERALVDALNTGEPQSCMFRARPDESSGIAFETRVTRAPRNHLVLEFREVRSEIPRASHAGELVAALATERRLYRQLFTALPTPALVLGLDG